MEIKCHPRKYVRFHFHNQHEFHNPIISHNNNLINLINKINKFSYLDCFEDRTTVK